MMSTASKTSLLLLLALCFQVTSCAQTDTLSKKDIESYEETIKARAKWKSASLTIAKKLNDKGKLEESSELLKLAKEHEFFIGCLSDKQKQKLPYKEGNAECHQERPN